MCEQKVHVGAVLEDLSHPVQGIGTLRAEPGPNRQGSVCIPSNDGVSVRGQHLPYEMHRVNLTTCGFVLKYKLNWYLIYKF